MGTLRGTLLGFIILALLNILLGPKWTLIPSIGVSRSPISQLAAEVKEIGQNRKMGDNGGKWEEMGGNGGKRGKGGGYGELWAIAKNTLWGV